MRGWFRADDVLKIHCMPCRIHEVNQHLNSLMSSDISFPMSINLAVGGAGTTGGANNNKQPRDLERQISRLKDQNR